MIVFFLFYFCFLSRRFSPAGPFRSFYSLMRQGFGNKGEQELKKKGNEKFKRGFISSAVRSQTLPFSTFSLSLSLVFASLSLSLYFAAEGAALAHGFPCASTGCSSLRSCGVDQGWSRTIAHSTGRPKFF